MKKESQTAAVVGRPIAGPNFRLLYVSLLAGAVGLISGIAAWLLMQLIGLASNLIFYHTWSTRLPLDLSNNTLGGWVIVIPAVAGLIIGLMAKYGTSKICGHGIPEAMEAVLTNRSRISPRVAILKPIATALAIGSGQPFGAEGPIIQTGGALGSMVGQLLHVTAVERKVLLACGAASGMSAIFSTPVAAVIFAVELLLFEFKPRSFIPLVIASTISTAVHYALIGSGPMFHVMPADFRLPIALPFYALAGILFGLAAVGFSKAFYWVEDLFEKLPIDQIWWPAIGGLGLGLIGYFQPRVLGVGYKTITDLLNGQLGLMVLLSLVVFKTLALLVSLGSGTSGGLLAPLFTSGAALGGLFAMLLDMAFPSLHLSPAAFALVGMAAVFAAASRSTFAFIIFAFEITREYSAMLPLMLCCVIASGVAMRLSSNSIMTERLARRGLRINQDYEVDVFAQLAVRDAMLVEPVTVPASMPVAELADQLGQHDRRLRGQHAFPILDAHGRLAGIITRADVLDSVDAGTAGRLTVIEAGSRDLTLAYPDEHLQDALAKMLQQGIGHLPVVDRDAPGRLAGFLCRSSILEARQRKLQADHVVEEGWLKLSA